MKAIAVVSGKGGVGKSVVGSTVIQELFGSGYRVGAVDADYSNPNLGRLLRIPADCDISITQDEKKLLVPAKPEDGMEFFSIEKIVQDRGIGMSSDEYAEITRDVLTHAIWNVDYMVLDLPAVVGSEFATVVSVYENDYVGSIIVALPAHLGTTERIIKLHLVKGVPVLGVLENMVSYECPDCHSQREIFGDSGAEKLCGQYKVPFLGKIPYDPNILKLLSSQEKVKLTKPEEVLLNVKNAILKAEPKKLGFLAELREGIKGLTEQAVIRVLAESVVIINKFVDIGGLQKKHNFPGGQVIELRLFEKKIGEGKPVTYNYRVANGQLRAVANPVRTDAAVYTTYAALVWIARGKKRLENGQEIDYSLVDAFSYGDAKIQGAGSVIKAISFYRDIWDQAHAQLETRIAPLILGGGA